MDAPQPTLTWHRWYFSVAVVFGVLALCAMVAATAWALLGQPRTALLFTAVGGGMVGVLLVWQAWVCPWCRAGDGPSGMVESPQHELRDLHFAIWLLPISLAVVGGLVWFGEPKLRQHLEAYFFWWGYLDQLALLLLITAGALAMGSVGFSWLVARRYRRRTAAMHVCFDCGYDLHASPGETCPECGEARRSAV
ncbi:hypothetical protein ACERK3_03765 [Phycisphaerales bacterium AB-hyl4]|uniref:Zinc ribbon protein n=1 Tax=Natronomicrosphaera hydrolytica TaxID=3242702 RepID=A0ABV4U1D0_9BACT